MIWQTFWCALSSDQTPDLLDVKQEVPWAADQVCRQLEKVGGEVDKETSSTQSFKSSLLGFASCNSVQSQARQDSTTVTGASSDNVAGKAMVALHTRLEDLSLALLSWETITRRSQNVTSLADEQAAVAAADCASAAFEDFRVNLCSNGESRVMQALALLKELPPANVWRDMERIQMLLRARQVFLDARLDAGPRFLEAAREQRRWPEADALAAEWLVSLGRVFGEKGSLHWRERARARLRSGLAVGPTPGPDGTAVANRPLLENGIPVLVGRGCLRIRNIRAKNLRRADYRSKIEPYVLFDFAGSRACTSVLMDNEDSPEWATEEMIFEVDALQEMPMLCASAWNMDGSLADDPLGCVDDVAGGLDVETGTAGRGLDVVALLAGIRPELVPPAGGRGLPDQPGRPLLGRRQVCCLPLRGEGAGDRGASIGFEIIYSEGGSADPLVYLQDDTQENPMLELLADVEQQLDEHLRSFGPESDGFFLPQLDAKPRGLGPPLEVLGIPATVRVKVSEYISVMDELSFLVTSGAAEASKSAGLDVADLADFRTFWSTHHLTYRQLEKLRESLRAFEFRAGQNETLRRSIEEQDSLLPTIGVWSTERRRRLRDQVFLTTLRLRHYDVCGVPVWIWQPLVLVLLLSGGMAGLTVKVLNMDLSWKAVLLPFFCLIVVLCAASFFSGDASTRLRAFASAEVLRLRQEPFLTRLLDSGPGYCIVPTCDEID